MISIGCHAVRGAVVDSQTRCQHYRSAVDVVALRFHCCDDWYPCASCHDEAVSHPRTVWPASDATTSVALCGCCGTTMTASEYRSADACAACTAAFNPRCALHHHLYFA